MPNSKNGRRKSDKIIVLDCHAVCHAQKHIHGILSYDDRPTGIIYGFLNQILSLSKKFETSKFLFAWDSGRSFRKDVYLKYKERDVEYTEEEILEHSIAKKQFTCLRQKVLPQMGFKNIFIQTGLEGDDIIASLVIRNKGDFIVCTDDKDLYQLLDHCNLWLLRKKKLYTKEHLLVEWLATPDNWRKQKEYSGCRGDKVPHVPGVADKTAIKYVKGEMKITSKVWREIEVTDPKFIKRSALLTALPFPGTKIFKLDFNENFEITNFIRVFDQYGFSSFMKKQKIVEWKEFCKGGQE